MFAHCTALNQPDMITIEYANTSACAYMYGWCTALKAQTISGTRFFKCTGGENSALYRMF